MYPFCDNNPLWYLLPLLLGFLTGWWAWSKLRGAVSAPDPVVRAPDPVVRAPDPVVVAPEPVMAAPEPVAVAAPVVAAPVVAAAAPTVALAGGAAAAAAIGIAAAVGDPDDLLKIKGIGPKLNTLLNKLGITRFDQIAAWSRGDVEKVDGHLESFAGRIDREEWIPQAKLLSTGQDAEWERIYGTVKKVAGVAAAGAGAIALTAIGIPAAVGDADDLLQIKGIGPKLNKLLISLGVTRFDQIAAWGASEIDKVDDHLGTFKNRITRDSWVEQAGLLARGAIAEFEAKFGKLDSENN